MKVDLPEKGETCLELNGSSGLQQKATGFLENLCRRSADLDFSGCNGTERSGAEWNETGNKELQRIP
jgi:hypothetical protein